MFENNNRVDRFAIRKLTVGVASVLIGVCFLGGNVNTVSADPIGGDAQTEESVKTDEPAKPVVEARTDEETEAGSDRDAGAVETEQGQQKVDETNSVVNGEPATEYDNLSVAQDGVSEGKGLAHVGDAGKAVSVPIDKSENSKTKPIDKGTVEDTQKIKDNTQVEREQTSDVEHGQLADLEDSKVKKIRKNSRVREGEKEKDSDSNIKIPASAVKTKDDKGNDCYIDHADVERTFDMYIHYDDVRVKLDKQGLFATDNKAVDKIGYDIIKSDFIPARRVYTLTLKYTGDRYYDDENGNVKEDKGNWIVTKLDLNVSSGIKKLSDDGNPYPLPVKGSKYRYDADENDEFLNGEYGTIYSPSTSETSWYNIDPNETFFPILNGKYFLEPYSVSYIQDENGNYKLDDETSVYESSCFGAQVDSTSVKYAISAYITGGSTYGFGVGFPHVSRPILDKYSPTTLNVTINYYEMSKVIAIDENGNKIQSLNQIDPRGTNGRVYEDQEIDTVEELNKKPLSIPNIMFCDAGSAIIDLSEWYENGYHMADLGNNENRLPHYVIDEDESTFTQGLRNFAKKNGFDPEKVCFYGGIMGSNSVVTKDKKGIWLDTNYNSYGLREFEYRNGMPGTPVGGSGPIFIVMTPNDQTNTVIVRDSKTGKDLETVSIAGKTDETVPVNLTFPEKYVLHDGYKWITDYTFKGGSQKPVIILVDPYEHKKGDPLIDDKPEFPLPKPEKKPGDKPKTPDDKPKTPDKPKVPDEITVPDITDVSEPALLTPNDPKEPKGENIDETLTTGVKGQDVTKPKQNNPVKPMAQDIKQPKQPVVRKVAQNTPKSTLPQTGERSSILLSVLGGLVALTGLIYLGKDRKNKKA